MYAILNEQEEIFWPLQKRQKTFMKTTRKNSEDPLTFLSELWKKAKFCRISQIIDRVECNHGHQKVKFDQNNEAATEKFIIFVYFNGLNHNDFAAYVTDKFGRAKEEAKIKEINRLWLQYVASTRLEFINNHNGKNKKAEAKKSNKKPKKTDYCFKCYLRGHRSKKCRNASGEIWN